jgi:uncharacterized protein YdhG (YjbR/CyaY superfamily)
MSAAEVDEYLAAAPEPQRTALATLRRTLAGLLPDAEQGIAYGVPTFKEGGRGVAGFGWSRHHCSYFPMSGSITAALADQLTGCRTAKGSFRFPPEAPPPPELLARLVAARREEIARTGR